MLSAEQNAFFTQVGRGTPMGDYLRRYWLPIAGESEFDANAIKPVRILGEDLVLFRDLSGTFGLVERHCAHRRADLAYGYVEKCGIRCNYHGWHYDADGRCIEQPFEDVTNPEARFRDKVRLESYSVEVKHGLIWAYFGPQPAPLIPTFEPFLWKNGFVQIVTAEIPCNWFQCQENSIDPVHFEWMHRNWSTRLRGATGPYAARHLKLGFEEFPWGHVYRRVTDDTGEDDPLWTVGRVCLWPNALFVGKHFEWRVPIDDTNTLSVMWHFSRVPNEREPYVQDRIPTWQGPIRDPQTGRWITSHVMNQDFVAWLGQGVVADRTREHLGTSDRGIIMLRKRFVEDIAAVAAGARPKASVWDADANRKIELPIVDKRLMIDGAPADDMGLRAFIFQSGQPEAVTQAWQAAMGFAQAQQTVASQPDINGALRDIRQTSLRYGGP